MRLKLALVGACCAIVSVAPLHRAQSATKAASESIAVGETPEEERRRAQFRAKDERLDWIEHRIWATRPMRREGTSARVECPASGKASRSVILVTIFTDPSQIFRGVQ